MSRFSQWRLGFVTLWEGFRFLWREKSLWIWALLPFTLSLLILFAGFGLGFHYFDVLIAKLPFYLWLDQIWAETIQPASTLLQIILIPLFWILKYLVVIPIVFLIGLVLLTLLCFFVHLIVSAPFSDLLAEKTTFLYRGENPPLFSWDRLIRGLRQTIGVELKKIVLLIAVPLVLSLLMLIPIIGMPLYLLLTALLEMWVLGFSMVDYPMSQNQLPFGERLSMGRRHKLALIGFGFPFLIPLAPLLLQAPMVVGGTILFHKLRGGEQTPAQIFE